MLPVAYDPSLVVASVLVAIMASFTALRLTNGISALDPARRKPIIAQSAVALGGGIELHASSCPSGGTVELFLEPMRQDLRLVVCGASPVAAVLAKLARSMGFRTVSAALPEDRHKVDIADDRLDGFDLSPLAISDRDAVVVATQGKRDREALKAALASPAGYVGMVGSRAKVAALLQQLGAEIPSARKSVLHGPAGLDIGAIDPEEIALSILAEIVQERRRSVRAEAAETEESVAG